MNTRLFGQFRRSVPTQIVKICMPIVCLALSTSVLAGYSPPPEQDPPKDPGGSTSLILDVSY